ncbi:MAG: hypothetical protein WCE61_08225, partial [Candidatus Acidiferrum sp.]
RYAPSPLTQLRIQIAQAAGLASLQATQKIPPHVLHARFHFPFGEKRALQTVAVVAHKFSPSHTLSIL